MIINLENEIKSGKKSGWLIHNSLKEKVVKIIEKLEIEGFIDNGYIIVDSGFDSFWLTIKPDLTDITITNIV